MPQPAHISHGQSLLHAGSGADSKGKAPVGSVRDGGVRCELALLQHYKVINSAYFSPITGEQGRRVCASVWVGDNGGGGGGEEQQRWCW